MRKFALTAALLVLANPALALPNAFGMTVTQTGPKDFTVNYKANARPADYWCTAGRFAEQTLHLSDLTRIYRATLPPQHVGQGVDFSLDPARSVGTTGFTTFGSKQDGGMEVGSAIAEFCFDWEIEDF
ncbi:hypothetical protein GC209_04425 [bacterium]|nr:hypothetical protein [bacterium]